MDPMTRKVDTAESNRHIAVAAPATTHIHSPTPRALHPAAGRAGAAPPAARRRDHEAFYRG